MLLWVLCSSPFWRGQSLLQQVGDLSASPASSQVQLRWKRRVYISKLDTDISELRLLASDGPNSCSPSRVPSSELIAEHACRGLEEEPGGPWERRGHSSPPAG